MAVQLPEPSSTPPQGERSCPRSCRDPVAGAIVSWLDDGARGPALWLSGRPGSGRSTAVRDAVGASSRKFAAYRFLECFPEMHFEEVLAEIGTLLAQSGDSAATAHVLQRNSPTAKVSAVLRALRDRPVFLALDAFDRLDAAALGSEQAEFVEAFVAAAGVLRGGAARVIVVAGSPPSHLPAWRVLETANWSDARGAEYWESLAASAGGGPPVSLATVPARFRQRPLAIKLVFHLAAHLPAAELEKSLSGEESGPLVALVVAAMRSLSSAARSLLVALAAFPPAPSRQALREVLGLIGWNEELGDVRSVPAFAELFSRGLLEPCDAQGHPERSVRLHPAVREEVARLAAGTTGARWEAVQAAVASYYLRRAQSSESLWDLVRAWRRFVEGKFHDEAYEVQKSFLLDVMQRGYLDLVRGVLEITVEKSQGAKRRVALGNLAMVHKNSGDLAEAERLYATVFAEFDRAGDLANAARTLHQLGNTQYARGLIDEALASYERSIELSSRIGQDKICAVTRVQIGNSLQLSGRGEEALPYYEQALETLERERDTELAAAVHLQIAQVHLEAKRHLEAEAHLAAAEAEARSSGDLRRLQRVLRHCGAAARLRRDDRKAHALYTEALATIERLGDALEAVACLLEIAELEVERLQLADGLRSCLTARALLEKAEAGGDRYPALSARVTDRLAALRAKLGPQAYERIVAGLRRE